MCFSVASTSTVTSGDSSTGEVEIAYRHRPFFIHVLLTITACGCSTLVLASSKDDCENCENFRLYGIPFEVWSCVRRCCRPPHVALVRHSPCSALRGLCAPDVSDLTPLIIDYLEDVIVLSDARKWQLAWSYHAKSMMTELAIILAQCSRDCTPFRWRSTLDKQ